MRKLITDEGFVLKRISFQEKDLILHILTKQNGKISCFAKAAKNSKKRFGPSLELASHVQCVYLERASHSGMNQLQEANSISSFDCIRQNYVRMIYAFFCLYVLDRLVPEGDKNRAYFDVLHTAFDYLNNDQKKIQSSLLYFCLNILKVIGLWPELKNCFFCLKEEVEYFVLSEREIFSSCLNCNKNAQLIFNHYLEYVGGYLTEEEFFNLFYFWFKNYLLNHLGIELDYYYHF